MQSLEDEKSKVKLSSGRGSACGSQSTLDARAEIPANYLAPVRCASQLAPYTLKPDDPPVSCHKGPVTELEARLSRLARGQQSSNFAFHLAGWPCESLLLFDVLSLGAILCGSSAFRNLLYQVLSGRLNQPAYFAPDLSYLVNHMQAGANRRYGHSSKGD